MCSTLPCSTPAPFTSCRQGGKDVQAAYRNNIMLVFFSSDIKTVRKHRNRLPHESSSTELAVLHLRTEVLSFKGSKED